MKVQVLHREPLLALGLGGLIGEAARRPLAAPGPARAVGLRRSGLEVAEVDALVGRATVETQVQVLVVVALLHRVHHLLRHPHGKGQVTAHLPHHYGRSDVPGLNLHVLPGNLLHHPQSVRSVPVTSVLGAVRERSRQLVRLRVVHLLVHAFLEVLEDDGQLRENQTQIKKTFSARIFMRVCLSYECRYVDVGG
uniref:Secreted protein n=1 Tax=Gasterosteus aculeatus aculeatus TaxID=481459 RepID=G3PIS6_GASAC